MNFLKLIQNRCKGVAEPDMNSILAMSSDDPTDAQVSPTMNEEEAPLTRSLTILPNQPLPKPNQGKSSSSAKKVPSSAIEFALTRVNNFTLFRQHEDIDTSPDLSGEPNEEQWSQFIDQFYLVSQLVSLIHFLNSNVY